MAHAFETRKTVWTGVGGVYLGKFNDTTGSPEQGYLENLVKVGCRTTTLALTPSVETNTITETCTLARGALRTPTSSTSLNVDLALEEFDVNALARYYMGENALTAADTGVSEDIPNGTSGELFFTQHPNVTGTPVISDGTPAALTKDTDYEVVGDPKDGAFRWLKTITSLPAEITYDHDESVNLPPMTQLGRETGLLFIGENSDGERARIVVPRINLQPNGEFNWISVDGTPVSLSLSGPALLVSKLADDANSPYGPFARIVIY